MRILITGAAGYVGSTLIAALQPVDEVAGIIGIDLKPKPDRLAASTSLWERRIAIIATLHFIRSGDFAPTLHIADHLIDDGEDLIHKAVGWMLREVGDRDRDAEKAFLAPRYRTMPRTMLRYAIEKFPETERQAYLKGTA